MEFRPCIDIHNGQVKQIVGGSLKDEGNQASENYVSEQDAAFYARLYQKQGIRGGHVILLNKEGSEYYEATRQQAIGALGPTGRPADRRRHSSGKCSGVSGCRSQPCDRDFLCIS